VKSAVYPARLMLSESATSVCANNLNANATSKDVAKPFDAVK